MGGLNTTSGTRKLISICKVPLLLNLCLRCTSFTVLATKACHFRYHFTMSLLYQAPSPRMRVMDSQNLLRLTWSSNYSLPNIFTYCELSDIGRIPSRKVRCERPRKPAST